jgi:hypothetical protein
MELHIGEIHNLNSACVNSRMIRILRTVRTVHRTQSRYYKSTLERKSAHWTTEGWLEGR